MRAWSCFFVGFALVACNREAPSSVTKEPTAVATEGASPAPSAEIAPASHAELGKPAPDFELEGLDGKR